jgi:hypothetical protein
MFAVSDGVVRPWICECACHAGFLPAWVPDPRVCIRCGHPLGAGKLYGGRVG